MARQVAVHHKGGAVRGALWMFLISLLLIWLPFFGPLIAGFVGGKKAGGVGSAIGAVFLPALVLGVFLFVLGTAAGLPLVGAVTGATAFLFVAVAAIGPMLLGAILGGALA
jgi:hypothetical protein